MGKSQRILAWSFLTTFSGSTYQSLLCSRSYSAHIALYIIEATLLCLSVYSVPASLLQPLVICATVSACCLHNLHLGSWILHSVVDLVCHCPGVEELLLSCHDQRLGVCFDVAFIELLICACHVCNFRHTFAPGTMQRLLIPCCSFIWLFPSGYEALYSAISGSLSAFLLT